uniref:UDP-N-acetylglucosamine transferase subunit ALG13 n=1 Tax=Callorhinchus milii TaxID=7868 RepID=A0A4W3JPK6_CALMI
MQRLLLLLLLSSSSLQVAPPPPAATRGERLVGRSGSAAARSLGERGWSAASRTPSRAGARVPAGEAMDSVFVTVGTTSFDQLIECVSSDAVTRILQTLGCRKLTLQVGRGSVEPKAFTGPSFTLDVFRFKESIAEDIQSAGLVISHAGAGSCLEALGAGKPLIVVINENLMDNHQLELAKRLHRDGHLLYCTCSTLPETLRSLDFASLEPFPPGHPEKFANFVDRIVGFQ